MTSQKVAPSCQDNAYAVFASITLYSLKIMYQRIGMRLFDFILYSIGLAGCLKVSQLANGHRFANKILCAYIACWGIFSKKQQL